jgi:hypothetical protein
VPTRDFDPQPVETAEGESDAEVQVTRSPIPVAPNLYLHKNVSMLATSGVGDDEARAFLMGTRKDKNLTQLEGRALGAEFVSADHFNGVYVNYERVHAILPDAGIFTSAKSLSEPFKEQLFQARVVDSGVFYEAQTELNPKGPALGEFIDGFIGGLGAAAGSAAPSLGGGTMDDGSMGGGVPDEDLGGDLKLDPPSGAMPGGGPSGGGLEDGPNLKLKNFESD